MIASMMYPHSTMSEDQLERRVAGMNHEDRMAVARAYVGTDVTDDINQVVPLSAHFTDSTS